MPGQFVVRARAEPVYRHGLPADWGKPTEDAGDEFVGEEAFDEDE